VGVEYEGFPLTKPIAVNTGCTTAPNLVNLRPTISKFSLVKRAIFAVVRPQFDDDLHLSRWRLKTDWKITILITA